ncbi:ROK family transcriptional regulator [Deinococcus yavapaiensis]|uniref:Glucokinase-like ROK family protein n=1 Tax=Deinococcus yavapaiensis KR-236 TaxID=694435 RepID=A0A318SKS5_9DEIO|nr:ROK family transcriptional regulator [Deinococcus yavapaiensis]PYE54969.1 glucokinase-like ROK family protein [Deinococcus yavapaiensis KR-236]
MTPRIRTHIGLLGLTEAALLSAVSWEGQVSRRFLVERTGFSKSKVVAAIANLLEAGLVRESGPSESTGGRRSEQLTLHPDLGVLLAVDLGATSLDVAVLSLDMTPLASHHEAADVRHGPGPVMTRVKAIMKTLLARLALLPDDVLAVGMGVPGPVAFDSGLLVNPPIMPGWEGFSIRDDLAAILGAPVFVDNDVNVLALGELWAGRRFAENFLVVKVGTGIGCGIVCGGRIYRGADGAAGDVGHICVDPLGPVCHCGNVGCVEAMAAGPAIAKEARAAAESGESAVLAELLKSVGSLTPVEVARASREGDMVATAIIQRSGVLLGRMLASLVNFFNPSHIVLTGGISLMGPLWLASIRQSVYGRSLALSTRHIELRLSRIPDRGGLVGAGVLALNSTLEAAKARSL